jgi:hypothetical protein
MDRDRALAVALGAGALLALAASAASARSERPAEPPSTRPPTVPPPTREPTTPSEPSGSVILGPPTELRPDGDVTHWENLSDEERIAYAAAERAQGRVVTFPVSDPAKARAIARARRAARLAAEKAGKPARDPFEPGGITERAIEQERRDDLDDLKREIDARVGPPTEEGQHVPELPQLEPPTPINLELARREAPAVAKHVRTKKYDYSRQTVRDFQRHAGIVPDGIYGPITMSALTYFGASAPPALFKGAAGAPTTYVPTQ